MNKWGRWFALGVGIIFCAIGGWGISRQFYFTHKAAAPLSPKKVVTYSVSAPEEAPIPSQASYEVLADQPRRIVISSIGLDAFIQQAGTDQHNRVAVPDNVHLAGWYTKSVPPGDPGLSIIDGHVTGQYANGVFINLDKIRIGNTISVEYGDKITMRSFRVKSVLSVPVAEATDALFTRVDGIRAQLNLVTCTAYNNQSKSYDKRIIVVAEGI